MKYFLILFIIIFVKAGSTEENVKELQDWTFEYSGFVKLNSINLPALV